MKLPLSAAEKQKQAAPGQATLAEAWGKSFDNEIFIKFLVVWITRKRLNFTTLEAEDLRLAFAYAQPAVQLRSNSTVAEKASELRSGLHAANLAAIRVSIFIHQRSISAD